MMTIHFKYDHLNDIIYYKKMKDQPLANPENVNPKKVDWLKVAVVVIFVFIIIFFKYWY